MLASIYSIKLANLFGLPKITGTIFRKIVSPKSENATAAHRLDKLTRLHATECHNNVVAARPFRGEIPEYARSYIYDDT